MGSSEVMMSTSGHAGLVWFMVWIVWIFYKKEKDGILPPDSGVMNQTSGLE